jgi:hypothetical protein
MNVTVHLELHYMPGIDYGAQVYHVETVVPIVDQGFSCEEESIADIAVTAISSEVWELCICCTTV